MNRRRLVGTIAVVGVAAGAGYAIYGDRHSFVAGLHRLGAGAVLTAFACGVVGTSATYFAWREVLGGLGVALPVRAGSRVYFVSQLGKYLPGSVWPVLMQMEAGRAHGASRRTMFGANIVTVVLGCCTGLIVACLLLPLQDTAVIRSYWWILITLPVLAALLHPRALPALIDAALRVLHRPPLGQRLDVRAEARAAALFMFCWFALGLQMWILSRSSAPAGHGGGSLYLLCTGGAALATCVGVLTIPVPAGAGVRELVMTLVLRTRMDTGAALAVVVTARVLVTVADAGLAALAVVIGGRGVEATGAPGPSVSGSGPDRE